MKKLLSCIAGALMVLVIGCAAGPSENVRHTVDLNITSDQPVSVMENTVDTNTERVEPSESPYMEMSPLTDINQSRQVAVMYIFSGIGSSDTKRVYNDITYLKNETDIREVEVYMNSPGGSAFEGLAMADLFNKFKKDGFHFTAHATGMIASAAVPVYASMNVRYATTSTFFMVHEAALYKWPGRETASDIRSQNEMMIKLAEQYVSLLPTTKLTRIQWMQKMAAITWFSADQAKEWGLVDEIE